MLIRSVLGCSTTDLTTGSTTDLTTDLTTGSTTGSTTDLTTGSTTDLTTGSTTGSTTDLTTDLDTSNCNCLIFICSSLILSDSLLLFVILVNSCCLYFSFSSCRLLIIFNKFSLLLL